MFYFRVIYNIILFFIYHFLFEEDKTIYLRYLGYSIYISSDRILGFYIVFYYVVKMCLIFVFDGIGIPQKSIENKHKII